MSITAFTAPDGKIGYRVRVSLGKNEHTGKYESKCVTVYGSAIQAKATEDRLKNTANCAKIADAEYDILVKTHSMKWFVKQIKFDDAFDLAMKSPACRSTSEKRKAFHKNYWNDFASFMNTEYPDIKTLQKTNDVHALEYFKKLKNDGPYAAKNPVKLSPDTINEYLSVMKQVFNVLHRQTGMVSNPFDAVRKLKPNHAERQAYSEDQLKIIFNTADEYIYPMFFIGLFTGLSEGDVCTLKKSEVDFRRHHIYRKRNKTKDYSNKVSCIPMLPVLENYMKDIIQKNDSEFVLPIHAADYTRDRSFVSKKIKRFLEIDCLFDTKDDQNGKRTRKQSVLDFHSLRHTFCSIAGVAGIPINVVQNIVGHMTTKMTALYSQHIEEQDRLKWMQLFGGRLQKMDLLLPGITSPTINSISEDRQKLMDLIQSLPEDKIKAMINSI